MKSLSTLALIGGLSVLGQQSVLDNFQCLDDPKNITYNNSDEHPDLPQVRIMMCGYSSQCALNFVAYLHMKERLGMNVTFYPTTDRSMIWSEYTPGSWNYTYWGAWGTDGYSYPRNYFEWLYADDMDLNFEYWPTQLVRTNYDGSIEFDGKTEYVLTGKIDFGGFVGAYGEESIWIPKYYVESNPEAIIPQQLRENAAIRSDLIEGSSNGTTDYYTTYASNNAFDSPDMNYPIIWGSESYYFMSKYANDLKNSYPIDENNVNDSGLNMSFVAIGYESTLAALIKDLYNQRKAFLANIYTIDDNFGIIDDILDVKQAFEKVAFPRNVDQSLYDACFLEKKCQYPVGPIMKAANPQLESRFPEAFQYYLNFNMGNNELSNVVSFYHQQNSTQIPSQTERWLRAACEWMKSNNSDSIRTWNNTAWMVDVVRSDCLFGDDNHGCGYPIPDQTSTLFGGECDYYSGTCVCDYDELFGDDCRESCPGLVGPLANDTGNGYMFKWCSGNGECNTITRICTCDLGYGGEGCQIPYEQYKLPVGLQVVVILLSCMLGIVCIGCIVWLRMSAEYKTVKALSVNMTTIMTFGLFMVVCSNIALTQKVSSASCIAWQWLFGLGGILAIMSPLLKAYRVSRVFHGGKMLRAVKITDKMLMAMLIKCAILEALICIGYAVLHELFGGSVLFYNDDELRVEDKCNDNALTGYVSMGSYAYFFVMLCALTKYSYGTRRALSVFKESTCAYFSSFLSLLCTLITFVFYMATQDPTFRVAIQSFAIILVVAAVLILFYGTRIYTFYTEPENRNVTDVRAATHTSTSSAHTSVMKPGPSSQA